MNENINPFEGIKTKIMEAGCDCVDSSWHRFVAFFPYYRIYYIVSGHAIIFLENNKKLELVPGNLYFIPAFSLFDAHCDQILKHYWIHVNLDITTASYLSVFQTKNIVPALPTDEPVMELLTNIVRKPEEQKGISDRLASEGLLRFLISKFLPENSDDVYASSARFVPVLKYIDDNIQNTVTNAQLSELMYLSTTYFSSLFTKQFKISPQQYILQKRLNMAISMLFESNRSVREIAYACGFESENYFNRQFRKLTGMPPGKYRKISQKLNLARS